MKKTLLTLAMTGLATAAFANVSLYKTDAINAYVNGELHADYVHDSASLNVDNNNSTKVSVNENFVRLRLGQGLDFVNKDGLSAGYYVRLQTVHSFISSKPENGKKEVLVNDNFGKKVRAQQAYVYLGHKDFGKLTLGNKVNSVADYGFDYGLNTLLQNKPNTLIREAGLDAANDPTVKYDSPVYNGFKFAYSYSNNHKHTASANFSRQNSLYAQYDFGGTVLSATAAYRDAFGPQLGYFTSQVSHKTHGYEVALQNTSLYQGLYLGAAYDYLKDVAYKEGNQSSKTTANQLSLKAAYTVNQYFTPYAVLAYKATKFEPNADVGVVDAGSADSKNAVRKDKATTLAIGAQSNVYKYQSLNVKLFGEAAYVHHSYDLNKEVKLNKVKRNDAVVAVGAVVSF